MYSQAMMEAYGDERNEQDRRDVQEYNHRVGCEGYIGKIK
jgi:hypothetical protein